MIEWWQILYGAALSALLAALLLAAAVRGWRFDILIPGAVAALAGPIAWNAILHSVHGERFFTDLPFIIFPISWQDTGSGVFTLAAATLAYGLLRGDEPARRATRYALLAAVAALLVDIYLY